MSDTALWALSAKRSLMVCSLAPQSPLRGFRLRRRHAQVLGKGLNYSEIHANKVQDSAVSFDPLMEVSCFPTGARSEQTTIEVSATPLQQEMMVRSREAARPKTAKEMTRRVSAEGVEFCQRAAKHRSRESLRLSHRGAKSWKLPMTPCRSSLITLWMRRLALGPWRVSSGRILGLLDI